MLTIPYQTGIGFHPGAQVVNIKKGVWNAMQKRFARFLSLLLTLLMIPIASLAEAAPAETTPPERNADGMMYVLNAFDGTKLDLTQYKGKAIWINFFTGWCSYCMTEMPFIKQAFEAYSPDEVAILLIHVWDGENADDSAAVVKRFGLEAMTMIEDEDMSLSGVVGISGYPTNIFIDKQGYVKTGSYGLEYDQMAEILDGLGVAKADGQTPATETAP